MNLVSIAMKVLAPTIVSKLASSLGINSSIAQAALAAIVPSVLAGLVGKSSQSDGAGSLADMLSNLDPGITDKLGDLIGGDQQGRVAEQGLGSLGSLLGGSGLEALTGAIGKFTGTNASATSGLIGMAAPAILGALGMQQREQGLDAGGVARLLDGQKDNIAQAMPDGFAKLLDGSGVLDSIGPNLSRLQAASQPSASRPTASAPAQSGSFNWLPWAAGIVAAALAGWYLLGGESTPPRAALPEAPKIMLGDKNISGEFGGVMRDLHGTLAGITDAASAKAAVPNLRTAQGEIDRLQGLSSQLTGEAKTQFSSYVAKLLPLITPMLQSLADNSSIGSIIKPFLGPITSKLNDMAGA